MSSCFKSPTLIATVFLLSGCGMTQLKQREAALNQQQQIITKQQQQLEQENERLSALEEALNQENKRLEALTKSFKAKAQAQAQAQAKAKAKAKAAKPGTDSHVIIGELERVFLTPPDIELTARIDTGAKTSSLNAMDMVQFERDGKAHVRFNIIDPNSGKKIEIIRRVIRHVKIKEHEGEAQSRPVVKIRVRLGNLDLPVKMTLTDRSEFKNQVLIGRNFLRDLATVDVSQKFQTKPVINDE